MFALPTGDVMGWTIRLSAAAVAAVLAGLVGFHAGAQSNRTLEVNQIARVGESVITAEQYIQGLVEAEQTKPRDDRVHRQVLDLLIAERLLELEAERLEATVRPRELREEVERLEEGLRHEYQAYRAELQRLARQRGQEEFNLTWEEFLARRQMTDAQLQGMLRRIARQELLKRMLVGYWEESNERIVTHGVVLMTRREAEEVRARLIRGERIDVVARSLSMERRTREGGGLVGTVWRNDMRLEPSVANALWELKDGEFSQPVRTENGWWIVRRTHTVLANEANFWDLREDLLKGPGVTPNRFIAWRHALASSDRYAYEERMPGVDVEADQE
jgi:parvulin-like peptidyl-prolyl isomerase